MTDDKTHVYTLTVEIGRKEGDGLPENATGAAMMCFCPAKTEAEAVRETVAILKQGGLAPLDVSSYGTLEERLDDGHDINDAERAMMQQSIDENSVVVAMTSPFFDVG